MLPCSPCDEKFNAPPPFDVYANVKVLYTPSPRTGLLSVA